MLNEQQGLAQKRPKEPPLDGVLGIAIERSRVIHQAGGAIQQSQLTARHIHFGPSDLCSVHAFPALYTHNIYIDTSQDAVLPSKENTGHT